MGELVREGMERLTPSERKVARALLAAYPVAGLESLNQLAGRANVTAPTVLRFVRKLGFDGYPGFQKVLREEVHARMTSPLSLYRTQVPSPKEKVLDASLLAFRRAIDKTFRSLPASEFRAVVRLLADERRRIVLTGGRFSQLAAHYLYAQLRMVRPDCVLVGETFDPRTDSLVDVGRNDVVCLFDYRRYQEDTVEFGRGAAARGATVILFTDPWLSPLAEVASHVLTSYPDAPSPFDSMVGAFALVEAVLAGVVAQLGEEGRRRVERFETARGSSEDPVPETTNGGRRKRGRPS